MVKGDEASFKTPPSSPKVAVQETIVVNKTNIASRLNDAVRAAKPVNRSSDLVPLGHDYDQMRKGFQTLVGNAIQYHEAMLAMDKARMNVRGDGSVGSTVHAYLPTCLLHLTPISHFTSIISYSTYRNQMVLHFSSMSAQTPIFEPSTSVSITLVNAVVRVTHHITFFSHCFLPVGSTVGVESFATVAQAASKGAQVNAAKYKEKVLDYCLEWVRVVTTRVDKEMKDTKALHDKLNHYQNKVELLRNKVNTLEGKSKPVPKNLTEKLARNEKKLDQAWRAHEKCASKLCHLLDEVTKRGWKDLYPLVKASMNWEVEWACGEYDVAARLPTIAEDLTELFERRVSEGVEEGSNVPVVLADEESVGSGTTGPYDGDEATEGSLAGAVADEDDEHYRATAQSPSHGNSSRKITSPTSPTGVAHV
jgi:hypothetical protein